MADFYVRSAKALDRVLKDECSVKAAAAPFADSGRILALLINTLAYRSALMHAVQSSRVAEIETKVFDLSSTASGKKSRAGLKEKQANGFKDQHSRNRNFKKSDQRTTNGASASATDYPSKEAFLLVLCHDLLFQNRGIQAAKTWPPKVVLEKYRASIHAAMVKLQIKQGKSRIQDLRSGALFQEMAARMPRWIRINSLRATEEEVLEWLAENRWTLLAPGTKEIERMKDFAVSEYVPGLLAFHTKATSLLLQAQIYKENWVIMQDLASCFPAYILNPPSSATVIDATSAPGNKTSHLSAIMGQGRGEGKVIAFERDQQRFKILTKRLSAVGAIKVKGGGKGNVEPERKDFLTTKPEDYPEVTHMLLDPSCSGSGIVNRLDWLKEDDDVEEIDASEQDEQESLGGEEDKRKLSKREKRLHQLSEFQLLMVRHAFKFPGLQRVVYSTCSVNPEENEHVVLRALETEEAKQRSWKLAPRSQVIPRWPNRGLPEECEGRKEVAECMIRCSPGGKGLEGELPHIDACNGFFVSCFIRNVGAGDVDRKRPAKDDDYDDEGAEDEDERDFGRMETEAQDEEGRRKKAEANRKRKLKKKLSQQRKKQKVDEETL